ncbi:capsular polysaccharide transport system permease protein [Nitrosomonas eutropha]|uniref:chain-length determining protein n=1 Tax=Nitrosomonas eutropha TaxID=916 RepID=UPI00088D245D|nr:chain-length determining protein [Nitrosomonas eutropha]SCX11325.1 capsular polysaccharide transport system permease protein [Nitrosomonas eutropha]
MTSLEKSLMDPDAVQQKMPERWTFTTLFRYARRLIFVSAILASVYWLLIASDRYVSEANVIIRKTDSIAAPTPDISMLMAGLPGANRADQFLLREYLLSVDMLKKLDAAFDLRSHYSDWQHDVVSQMWLKDASMEWFHRHFLSRVSVEYDDFAGVLRIQTQAYDAPTAQAISTMMVEEGERYMNHLDHELAQVQVNFLTSQVKQAQQRLQEANQVLLKFQNEKGLLSPEVIAEGVSSLIFKLEEQRAQLQTQLASLPKNLERNHPNITMLKQSLAAVNHQIVQEKARLTNVSGSDTLNTALEEFQYLQMEVEFTREIYKTALAALEKGRIDATRLLEKVSVLQSPTLPEYSMEPRRIYSAFVTLLLALVLAGTLKLLEAIVQDHVD